MDLSLILAGLFSVENLLTLLMLVMLQAVLGFDNLLYISLESKNAPEEKQSMVRMVGIGGAIFLRIALLFVLVNLINEFKDPFWDIAIGGNGDMTHHITGEEKPFMIFEAHMKLGSLITLIGGVFILYTAIKEIFHMLRMEINPGGEAKKKKSPATVIFMIVMMNLVFSFDSILSAMALTSNTIIMSTAIIIGGILMIWLSNTIANFLKKNRLYEVLGLFILFVVGIMLISEGGHDAGLVFYGHHVAAMGKGTFYFIIVIMVLIDIVQGRYHKKLTIQQQLAKQIQEGENEASANGSDSEGK